jgi:hypothetical protein
MRCRPPLILAAVVAVAAFSLFAAGCGGSGSPGVANVAASAAAATTTAATTTETNRLLAFSSCMRSNGMPNFPDPQRFVGGNVKLTLHQLGAGSSPQFQAAIRACNHLLPTNGGGVSQQTAQQQRTQLADGLAFARCMRSHAVSRFPDPNAQGQLTVEMVEAQGIDVHSPAVLQAVRACLPASHGLLTPAKVAEALSNASG